MKLFLKTHIVFFLFFNSILLAQTNVDSLKVIINNSKDDTIVADAYKLLSYYYYDEGNYSEASNYSEKLLNLSKKINFKNGIFSALMQNSRIKLINADYNEAMKIAIDGLKLSELYGIKKFQLAFYVQSGNILKYQKNNKKAISFYEKAIKIAKEENDVNALDVCYNNIGTILSESKEYDKALYYYQQSLAIGIQSQDSISIAGGYANIGTIYFDKQQLNDAKEYYQNALVIYEKYDIKNETASMYLNIARIVMQKKKYKEADELLTKALTIYQQINNKNLMIIVYETMADNYTYMNDIEKAYNAISMAKLYTDSVYTSEMSAQTSELETKYDTEKKEAENELLKQKNENQQLSINRQRIVSYFIVVALALFMALAFFIFRGYKQKQKANLLLEEKSKIIEEKNKDITDSINYAKRIQNAILPEENLLLTYCKSFIYYQPKDIVSGDFYWIKQMGNKLYFSVVDCTGHGVPGAFMSIIGFNALNKIVEDLQLSETGLILDKLNELVLQSIRQQDKDGSSIRDGMDLSICCLDLESNMVEFSGANNPLYILRTSSNDPANLPISITENGYNLLEIKADKMAIGGAENSKKYRTRQVQLQKGDTIYLFSDGYADQFGGPKSKKFMYKEFKALLASVQEKSMEEQKDILHKTISDWRGNLDQVDDICIIGVKI
jgi:serine phosphatase RsbU (regulator of sigma subunit)/Tfp pilus assembly protein PilF